MTDAMLLTCRPWKHMFAIFAFAKTILSLRLFIYVLSFHDVSLSFSLSLQHRHPYTAAPYLRGAEGMGLLYSSSSMPGLGAPPFFFFGGCGVATRLYLLSQKAAIWMCVLAFSGME